MSSADPGEINSLDPRPGLLAPEWQYSRPASRAILGTSEDVSVPCFDEGPCFSPEMWNIFEEPSFSTNNNEISSFPSLRATHAFHTANQDSHEQESLGIKRLETLAVGKDHVSSCHALRMDPQPTGNADIISSITRSPRKSLPIGKGPKRAKDSSTSGSSAPLSKAISVRRSKRTRTKRFTEEQTSPLKTWLKLRLLSSKPPYPEELDKAELSKASGLTVRQVETWFSRTRQRKLTRIESCASPRHESFVPGSARSVPEIRKNTRTKDTSNITLSLYNVSYPCMPQAASCPSTAEKNGLDPDMPLERYLNSPLEDEAASVDAIQSSLEAMPPSRQASPSEEKSSIHGFEPSDIYSISDADELHEGVLSGPLRNISRNWSIEAFLNSLPLTYESVDWLGTDFQSIDLDGLPPLDCVCAQNKSGAGHRNGLSEGISNVEAQVSNEPVELGDLRSADNDKKFQSQLDELLQTIREQQIEIEALKSRSSLDQSEASPSALFGKATRNRASRASKGSRTPISQGSRSGGASSCGSLNSAGSYASFGSRKGRRVAFQNPSRPDSQVLPDFLIPPVPPVPPIPNSLLSQVAADLPVPLTPDPRFSSFSLFAQEATAHQQEHIHPPYEAMDQPVALPTCELEAMDLTWDPACTSEAPQAHGPKSCQPKRLYQCTFFCSKQYPSKWAWKRHERSIHAPHEAWVCGPNKLTESSSVRQACPFCRTTTRSIEHLYCEQTTETCWGKPSAERTFYRKDHLVQHIRQVHCDKTRGRCLEQSAWSRSIGLANDLTCGFCGLDNMSWEARVSHVAKHFEDGMDMSSWMPPDYWALNNSVLSDEAFMSIFS